MLDVVFLEGSVAKVRSFGKKLKFLDFVVSNVAQKDAWLTTPCNLICGLKPNNQSKEIDCLQGIESRDILASSSAAVNADEEAASFIDAEKLSGEEIELILRCSDYAKENEFPMHKQDIRPEDEVIVAVYKRSQCENLKTSTEKKYLYHTCLWRLKRRSHTGSRDNPRPMKRKATGLPTSGIQDFSDSVHPLETDDNNAKVSLVPLCKYWLYDGSICRDEKKCKFRHYVVDSNEEDRISRLRIRRDESFCRQGQENERYRLHEDAHLDGETKAEKRLRAEVFADWVIKTFGIEVISNGTGVVDIAGGKGNICIELLMQSKHQRLQTTVIDPYKRKTVLSKRNARQINKIQCLIPKFAHVPFNDRFFEVPEYASIVENAGLVVGMHPDQATGDIVKHCVRLKRPFAVVPCCVFARDFPDRHLDDEYGDKKAVKCLNSLIDWLKSHHDSIRTVHLPFKGRNKVLYMVNEDFQNDTERIKE